MRPRRFAPYRSETALTPAEQAVLARLVAAASVLWVRVGDATDADVNQLGAAIISAKALIEAQKGKRASAASSL
jgi:hypothetical protein